MLIANKMTYKKFEPTPVYTAPDKSEIRLLVRGSKGSLCHCTLRPGQTSQAVKHKSIEEIWYCPSGKGEIWRQVADQEEITPIESGVSISISPGMSFQFRNTGKELLCIMITTMPP